MKVCSLHHLVAINDLPYRYQCKKCGVKLKIASGIVLSKLKKEVPRCTNI